MLKFWLIILLLTFIAIATIVLPLLSNISNKRSYFLAFFLSAFILLTGIFLYLQWGESAQVAAQLWRQKNAPMIARQMAKLGSKQNVIVELRRQLERLPNDVKQAKGWFILGKLYFNEQNYDQAIFCFNKALVLKPDSSEYLLQLVSSKFMVNHKIEESDQAKLQKVLAKSPGDINVANLLALNCYQRGDYKTAIRYWESLLQYFPPDSEDSKALLEMIKQGQSKMAEANHNSPRIAVSISVKPSLKNFYHATDTVFVYALAPSGPKIPLAVVRLNVSDLPKTIVLDESQSMLAEHSLATAKKIYIEARISKSGSALPSKNDLIGKTGMLELSLKMKPQVIVIDAVNH